MGPGDPQQIQLHDLPLRERFPEYLAVFAAGLAASTIVGVLIGLSSIPMGDAVGYTIIMFGVVFLLAGGASGGGYTNMGVGYLGSLFGGHRTPDEELEDPDVRRAARPKLDPRERLRRGLRPEANPRAFWQVVAGFAYVAAGLGVLLVVGS